MREILLTKGYIAQVDDDDYERVSKYKWQVRITNDVTPRYYAQRTYFCEIKGQKVSQLLHRYILNLTDPKVIVDHIDNNGLNNQKNNLRKCSISQNSYNSVKQGSPKNSGVPVSKYKGVRFNKTVKKWEARLQVNKKRLTLGFFKSELEASEAYNKAALHFCKEFARFKDSSGKEVFNASDMPENLYKPYVGRIRCGTSEYLGVSKTKQGTWKAIIERKGKKISLGVFKSEIDAAKAYNAKALELKGNKARLNVIPEDTED